MIAYFSTSRAQAFWEDHWAGYSVQKLLEVARGSPLTDLIDAGLPRRGRILEAGCGLGQYVLLLRERGRNAVGVDLSLGPLRECHKDSPTALLATMDLANLGFHSGTFAAYISLGVVEHHREGPDEILSEARRVLEPGGALILSVPYVNGVRRLSTWWIRCRNRQVEKAGGLFYQFAFSRREAWEFIQRNGFRVLSATPYDPARVLRGTWQNLARAFRAGRLPGSDGKQEAWAGPFGSGARTAVRRLLYTRPALHAFGHMILFVAMKV